MIDFAAKNLCLYEGEFAGEPLIARDWQIEVTMRLFGWVRWSERWKRWVRRFNAASIWVPKKNKKSPTLSWWGLYLCCADGEQGQKVYFAAKDGSQAREIAGKHAVEMARSSPALMAECSINQTLMQVMHEPTRSILRPISSGDAKSQKAKEGLNGCILVDETHVVDREFMNRVTRAGISRSEPLQIEVSTAGNDPGSYGRERYERGKLVESGEVEDERLLFVTYEAPHDVSDSQLAADPEQFGRLANPAWGHTIDPQEFLDDYQRSKQSVTQLADFKMYRLNVWQSSSNPWLRMGDWDACYRPYTAADLAGRRCGAGLDLALVRDTCALVLVFPMGDGTYRLLPHFWLPQKRAEALRDKAGYLQWAASGSITLTDGDTTDYQFIRKSVVELSRQFQIARFAYDDTYAAQLVQRLIEEDGALHKEQTFSFAQRITDFARPTDQFEGLVIEQKLHHPGSPVLTWQAGNTRIKVDANHNKRPVKQRDGDFRTIDGIVAGIMALEMAQSMDADEWYQPGMLRN